MPHFASEYLFAGTGYDEALENNRKVFNKIYLVPNYLKGTVNPNLKTKLFVMNMMLHLVWHQLE